MLDHRSFLSPLEQSQTLRLVVAKVVGGVVLFLILAVVGAGLYLLENLDGLVKQAIEQVGSDVMGTEVRGA